MKLLLAFLRLIRYPNLLYIFLTQYLLQYAVFRPVFARYGWQPSLGHAAFFLLSLSTVLIAAAGYIINDYFDVNTDLWNKPDKLIVDRLISRRWAMFWHSALNVIGVGIGFGLAWKIGYPLLGFAQLICTGLLWFYSTSYKRQLLIGNIVISFCNIDRHFFQRQVSGKRFIRKPGADDKLHFCLLQQLASARRVRCQHDLV